MDMEPITAQTPLREIEIFGIPALYAERVIPPDEQIPDIHYYEIISGEDNETLLGTVLTLIPVDIPDEDGREIYEADLILDTEGELLTPEGFMEKYFTPEDDPDEEEGDAEDE